MRPLITLIGCVFFLSACNQKDVFWLPDAVSNNAVTYHVPTETIYSFAGIGSNKDWQSVHAKSYKCTFTDHTCVMTNPLPDGIGRLAATTQTLDDTIYIFGGYSVGKDGSETSTPEVWAFDIQTQNYSRKADIPVPVDDSVSILYKNRYIYLISGWYKDDNVVNVQMYDIKLNQWFPATDWPGAPVFGHAGGAVNNVITVCDGVQIIPPKTSEARRTFETISACWRGDINKNNPTQIVWRKLTQLPGKGNYRMAATGWQEENIIIFAGGTDNAYNYNGIGYNKIPSKPSKHVWGYDITADDYILFRDKPTATMDHRALIHLGGNEFITLGGMGEDQQVLQNADRFKVHRSPK